MGQRAKTPTGFTTVFSEDTTGEFHPATEWMRAASVSRIRATVTILARTPNSEAAMAYQVANKPSAGGTVTEFGNSGGAWLSSVGITYPDQWTDISSAMASAQLVRVGFRCRNSVGSAQELVNVGADIETDDD